MAYDNNKNGSSPSQPGTAEIEILLGKYFEGATSLEEETRLREFFTSGTPVPDHLQYARAMFGWFSEASEDTGWPAVHPAARRSAVAGPRRRRTGLRLLSAALSAAAVTALAVLLFHGRGETMAEADVYCYVNGVPVTDPDVALDYSARVFEHISSAMREPAVEASAALEEQLSRLEKVSAVINLIEITNKNQ